MKNLQNFPVTVEGKEYWISRSVAVCCIIFTKNDGLRVLAVKRGDNLDEPGKWCLPCGYLDYNETLHDACKREVKEETGLDIDNIRFYYVDDNPNANRQNVTFIYWTYSEEYVNQTLSIDNIESVNIKWIAIPDIKYYDWAFGHKDLIKDVLNLI